MAQHIILLKMGQICEGCGSLKTGLSCMEQRISSGVVKEEHEESIELGEINLSNSSVFWSPRQRQTSSLAKVELRVCAVFDSCSKCRNHPI